MKNICVNLENQYEDLFDYLQKKLKLSQKGCVQEALISYGMELKVLKSRNEFLVNGIEKEK